MKHRFLLQIFAVVLVVTMLYVTPAITQWSADPTVNTAISATTGYQQSPTVVSDGSGGAIIAWTNGHIYAQHVNASGLVQWGTYGAAICTATGFQTAPTIVSDGSNGAIITWMDYRNGSDYDIYAQRVNASGAIQWTPDGVAICTATGDQDSPTIASDDSGGAIITWYDYRNTTDYNIFAQRVIISGTVQWDSNGVAICTAAGAQYTPTIISDGSRGAIIAWSDDRSANYDIYARHVSANGVAQWAPNGVPICTATGDQYYPTLVSDGSGGAIITWEDGRGTDWDIYAQRVNASGAAQWTPDGVAICTATDVQYYPTLVSDGSGGAIITWWDYRSGSSYNVYAQRVNSDSTVAWAANGVAICTETGDHSSPNASTLAIASDGSSGAIITWQDYRNGSDYDIYAQLANASGAVQYPDSGVAISTATGDQTVPTLVSDGSGGAIITWQDARSSSGYYAIYAQHLGSDGALPIQLASMTATTLTTGLQLQWTTVSETNSLGFYVERKAQSSGAYATVSNLIPGAGTSLQQHHYQWTDTKVTNGNYNYRLRLVDLNGATAYSNAIAVTVSGVLGVGATKPLPTEFALHQNYPNPFNPSTVINYDLPKAVYVRLVVYDMLGREVATLVNGTQEAGYKSVQLDASNMPSGLYIYRLNAGTYASVRKMLMLK